MFLANDFKVIIPRNDYNYSTFLRYEIPLVSHKKIDYNVDEPVYHRLN